MLELHTFCEELVGFSAYATCDVVARVVARAKGATIFFIFFKKSITKISFEMYFKNFYFFEIIIKKCFNFLKRITFQSEDSLLIIQYFLKKQVIFLKFLQKNQKSAIMRKITFIMYDQTTRINAAIAYFFM